MKEEALRNKAIMEGIIDDDDDYEYAIETPEIWHDFEQRLETIFGRQINRVHILDFEGLTTDMRQDLAERLRMVYTRDDGQEVFMSRAWRRLFDIRAPLVHEFFLELFSTCRIGDEMRLDAAGTLRGGRLQVSEDIYGVLLTLGREYDVLRGLSVMTREISLIDIGELVKLNICREIGDDWAWVALRPERHQMLRLCPISGTYGGDSGTNAGNQINGGFCDRSTKIGDLAERKEIDNVGEVSTIWKSRSVGALKSQDGCSTQSCS
ncbi:hypothetical protein Tco_0547737 [Tanacetum coccineum]